MSSHVVTPSFLFLFPFPASLVSTIWKEGLPKANGAAAAQQSWKGVSQSLASCSLPLPSTGCNSFYARRQAFIMQKDIWVEV